MSQTEAFLRCSAEFPAMKWPYESILMPKFWKQHLFLPQKESKKGQGAPCKYVRHANGRLPVGTAQEVTLARTLKTLSTTCISLLVIGFNKLP
jgi:hypothetical protein